MADWETLDLKGFLSALSDGERAHLMERMSVRSYKNEEVILAADDTSRSLYVLLEGRAVATLYSEDGKMIAYRDLSAADIFGELSAIDALPRSTFVVARGAVRAGVLAAEEVDQLLSSSPSFSRQILLHLSDSVRRMTDRLFETTTLLVRERLIVELMRRGREIDNEADRIQLGPLPTHADLAAYIGTHREAITRELGYLDKKGLIARDNKRVEILSMTAMEAELHERLT